MAGRIMNRRELRKQNDQADQAEATAPEASETAVAKKPARKKAAGVARVRKPRAKKAPPRMCVRWGIFDAATRQVGIFDYNQRAAADARVTELLAKGKGMYYVQPVKEAMAEPVTDEAEPVAVE